MAANPPIFPPEPTGTLVVVVAAVKVPIRSHPSPVALVVPIEHAKSVEMVADASVSAPAPLCAVVVPMIVVVAAVKPPVTSDGDPATAIPSAQPIEAVQVPVHSLRFAPEPSRWLVVVIFLPHGPVGSHMNPLVVPESSENATTVEVNANSAVAPEKPTIFSMEAVLVVVAASEMPVAPHGDPAVPIPSPKNSQTVEMPADATLLAPEPAAPAVVVVLPVEVPVRAHLAPFVQGASTVQMMADASKAAPRPPRRAAAGCAEMIFSVHHPLLGSQSPFLASPLPILLQSVHVSAHAFGSPPRRAGNQTLADTPHSIAVSAASGPGAANHVPAMSQQAPCDSLAITMRSDSAPTTKGDTDSFETTPSLAFAVRLREHFLGSDHFFGSDLSLPHGREIYLT
jgi:hypothetical protein